MSAGVNDHMLWFYPGLLYWNAAGDKGAISTASLYGGKGRKTWTDINLPVTDLVIVHKTFGWNLYRASVAKWPQSINIMINWKNQALLLNWLRALN